MELKRVFGLINRESRASRYLEKRRWKHGAKNCPRCRGLAPYTLSDSRWRCRACSYTFSLYTGTWLQGSRLKASEWLYLIKLFDLELSARKASQETSMNYKTVYLAFQTIRKSIVAHCEESAALLGGEIEADESYFGGRRKGNRGRGAAGKVPVFGLLERRGRIHVSVVPNVTRQTLMDWTVKKVRFGSLIYTDQFRSYDSLMTFGFKHERIDHGQRFGKGPVYINGLEGFWSFAKERLMKFQGVQPSQFAFYLKEMEFRYNHRDQASLFEILVNYITDLVPTSG